MPVLSLACHLRHNTPNIPSRYNNGQTTKQTKAINNSYIYINISCKCDTNRAGHFTLDAYASRPVACIHIYMTPFSIHGDTQKVLHTADYTLTHCGLVMPYGDTDLDQHWFRWWLITWQHQAITNVDLSPVKSSDIHLRAINSWDILQASITKSCFKLTNLKFPSNLLKANELINWSPKESARQTMECLNSNF